MARWKFLAFAGAMVGGASMLIAAQPTGLSQTQAGLWEISGAPGAKAPVRQCVTNLATLAEFEHRGKPCKLRIISNSARSSLMEYSCGPAGFGRSQMDMVTPRSLRIETQGISNQAPFNYVLQARRVGDCPGAGPAPGH